MNKNTKYIKKVLKNQKTCRCDGDAVVELLEKVEEFLTPDNFCHFEDDLREFLEDRNTCKYCCNFIEYSQGREHFSVATSLEEDDFLMMLEKDPDLDSSLFPWERDMGFLFFTAGKVKTIEKNYKDISDALSEVYAPKEINIFFDGKEYSFISKAYDFHHHDIFYDDLEYAKDSNGLELCENERFKKLGELDIALSARIKDHSYQVGAGRAYGHSAPDIECVYDGSDAESIREANYDFVTKIEDFLEEKLEKALKS